jgi:predicted nucleic acid-binding protein
MFLLDTNVISELRHPQKADSNVLVHGLTVVTRNVADFAPVGVPLLDPWKPQQAQGAG